MRARLRTPPCNVWQYTSQGMVNLPPWVAACTLMRDGDLLLVRASGNQLIDKTDWLVEDIDGETLWLSHGDFNREYELLWVTDKPAA